MISRLPGSPVDDLRSHVTVDVPMDHPCFAGHFPGHPVLPGVVLLDEVVAAAERHLARPLQALQVRVAKFHAPVRPGAQLCIELTGREPVRFSVTCDDVRVASGELAPADGEPEAP
jgi:3-hydroxymyristoyl/3-hydroxydecanoyl-(acyl carrier protein) dehydratase